MFVSQLVDTAQLVWSYKSDVGLSGLAFARDHLVATTLDDRLLIVRPVDAVSDGCDPVIDSCSTGCDPCRRVIVP